DAVPREVLVDLLQFDLDGPVLTSTALTEAMDLLLGFWDTHDRTEDVAAYPLLAEARLGKGRLMLCAFDLSLDAERPLGSAENLVPT
ncbi:MAG: hypothetical protein KDC87_12640, partial [Planctomycetes bacterium]|nr:hypothetical protein [Planctomycetota bacterium]